MHVEQVSPKTDFEMQAMAWYRPLPPTHKTPSQMKMMIVMLQDDLDISNPRRVRHCYSTASKGTPRCAKSHKCIDAYCRSDNESKVTVVVRQSFMVMMMMMIVLIMMITMMMMMTKAIMSGDVCKR